MEDEMTMIPTGDAITDRSHALVAVASAVDNIIEPEAKRILLDYMVKINRSVQVPTEEEIEQSKAAAISSNVTSFPGGH